MIDVTITLTLPEARTLLDAARRDADRRQATADRAVLDALSAKIEEAEKEDNAYNSALKGETHWARQQMYEGPSRYAEHSDDRSPRTG